MITSETMKNGKFALGIGLMVILALLANLFFLAEGTPISANPDKLKWSIVTTPSREGNVIVSPSEINAFVIGADGTTFYAVDIPGDPPGGEYPDGKVYKSIDGGITWTDKLTEKLQDEGANMPAWDVVVASGDSQFVVVVTDDRTEVYVSVDAGENWYRLNVPNLGARLIASIAISPEYGSGKRDIAIGTRDPGDIFSNGDIWVTQWGGIGSWKAQGLDMDVTSISFSPAYGVDKAILAIGSDDTGTFLLTGVRNTQDNTTDWDVAYPVKVEVSETSGDSPKKDEIVTSDLAVPGDYTERDDNKRVVFVAYNSDTDADDVYKIDYDMVQRLKVRNGDKVAIASIAYDGTCSGGELLAGDVLVGVDSNMASVHMCSNPTDCFPKWHKPLKFKWPTGGVFSQRANAQVAWSPDGNFAYCGTSTNWVESAFDWMDSAKWSGQALDESAFSRSKDGGDTWNQLSLIDTEMDEFSDLALSADYETLYLASVCSSFDSVWRSESEILGNVWERILCPCHKNDIILRPTPDEDERDAIFFAVVDTGDGRYSEDRGQTWEEIWDCPDITDLAVVSNEMFYILDVDVVHKAWWDTESWGGIWEWQRNIETNLPRGYSISVSGADFVFVGPEESEDKVAYSTDGGATFELTAAIPEPGDILIVADEEFSSNKFIYAASSEGKLYRWTIGGSTSWRRLNPPQSKFYGIAQRSGALYGAYRSGVARTLIPHKETVRTMDWDSLEVGLVSGVAFKSASLRAIADETFVDLWAIDGRNYDLEAKVGCLWVYTDTFVLETPWPTSPPIGDFLTCDICTCEADEFCFRWRLIPLAEEYDIWIALDEHFLAVLHKEENMRPIDCCNPSWCPPSGLFRFACRETYYWKVRASTSTEGEEIHSRWSPPMHFTVKTCSAEEYLHTVPVLKVLRSGSSDVPRSPSFSWKGFPGTTKYEFILAEDADLTQVIVREEVNTSAYLYAYQLGWGETYFWQVRAIAPVPSDPATATFTVISQPPAPQATPAIPKTSFWVWLIIGVLALVTIGVIVLSLTSRR